MKIAIVVTNPIFPSFGGYSARIASMIDHLTERGHVVGCVLLSSRRMAPPDLAAHRARLGGGFTLLRRSWLGEGGYLATRTARGIRRSLRRAMGRKVYRLDHIDEIFYRGFLGPLRDALAGYDAVLVNYAYFSGAFAACPPGAVKILDTHDSFAHEIAAHEEARGLDRADVVLAIQSAEAKRFSAMLANPGKVRIVSHMFPTRQAMDVSRCAGASFLGSSFAANIASLRHFVDRVLPIILRGHPDFILNIAGTIGDCVADGPGIRKLGRVDDVAEAFREAPVLVNCIQAGTGVKIKLLDALSLGVPCVSTRHGVEGLPDNVLNGVVVVDDADDAGFAAQVVSLWRDSARRQSLAARAFADAESWSMAQKRTLDAAIAAHGLPGEGLVGGMRPGKDGIMFATREPDSRLAGICQPV